MTEKPSLDDIATSLAGLVDGVTETRDWLAKAFEDALAGRQFDDDGTWLSVAETPRRWWLIISHLGATDAVLRRAVHLIRERER